MDYIKYTNYISVEEEASDDRNYCMIFGEMLSLTIDFKLRIEV